MLSEDLRPLSAEALTEGAKPRRLVTANAALHAFITQLSGKAQFVRDWNAASNLLRDVARRWIEAVADVDPAWSSGVWWFTPRAQVGLLQQRLQDAGAGAHHEVVTAPEGVAP